MAKKQKSIVLYQLFLTIVFIFSFIGIGVTWNKGIVNYFGNWVKPSTNNLHFLHISKNGGTSIKSLGKGLYGTSSHDFIANDFDKDFFAVIRDPVDRFVSAFNFAKRGGFNGIKNIDKHPISKFKTVDHFLDSLRDNDNSATRALKTGENRTPLDAASVIYWPQVHWLRSRSNKKLALLDFDNLNELFKQKFNVVLPESNKTANKVSTEISPENVEFLHKIYAPDFKLYDLVKMNSIYETDTDSVSNLGNPDKLMTSKKFFWV